MLERPFRYITMAVKNMMRNSEGYADPTMAGAFEAMEDEKKLKDLLHVLFYILNRSGFELVGRFELRSKKTGRVYK